MTGDETPPHVAMTTEPYMTVGARRAAHRLGWSLVILFAVNFVLSSGVLVYLSQQVNHVRRVNESSCRFFADLAGAPISVSPQMGKPSKLAVTIVSDARTAYRGRGCVGMLPPPSPSFTHWAKYYRMPYR